MRQNERKKSMEAKGIEKKTKHKSHYEFFNQHN